MKRWIIQEYDGCDAISEHYLPEHLSHPEIETVMQRLVCRDLSANEIIKCSFRKNDKNRMGFLDRVSIDTRAISYGHGSRHYIARLVSTRPSP